VEDAKGGDAARVTTVTDIAAGLVLAAISVTALLWLIPNFIESGASEYDIGPAFFPKLTAWVVLALSVALTLTNMVRYRASGSRDLSGQGWSVLFEIFAWTLVGGLTLFGLSKVSFLLTAALLVAFGAVVAGYRRWWVIAVLALVFPVVVDQIVWLVFTVDLP
jgi:tripartite tricarboxylate transporter TctB family protein